MMNTSVGILLIILLTRFCSATPYIISEDEDEIVMCYNSGKEWSYDNFDYGFPNTWNVVKSTYGEENRQIENDPAGSKSSVLKIKYPAGSRNPANKPVGGTGFYAVPYDLRLSSLISFSYEVFVPNDFNFVKGGKLPGLYGGHESCSGGNKALDCFSVRYMFRTNGQGEIYMYVDKDWQDSDICSVPPRSICNAKYGISVGRGAFSFQKGAWNKLEQIVSLNTFTNGYPEKNGIIEVYHNDIKVTSFDKVVYRNNSTINAVGIDFETFFGGSDESYNTPTTQYLYFRNFKLTSD